MRRSSPTHRAPMHENANKKGQHCDGVVVYDIVMQACRRLLVGGKATASPRHYIAAPLSPPAQELLEVFNFRAAVSSTTIFVLQAVEDGATNRLLWTSRSALQESSGHKIAIRNDPWVFRLDHVSMNPKTASHVNI